MSSAKAAAAANLADDFLVGKWWNIRIEMDPRPNVKQYRLYAKPVNPDALANSTLGDPVMAGTLAIDSLLPGNKVFIGFTGGTGSAWSRRAPNSPSGWEVEQTAAGASLRRIEHPRQSRVDRSSPS
jgi:hypothetical protein